MLSFKQRLAFKRFTRTLCDDVFYQTKERLSYQEIEQKTIELFNKFTLNLSQKDK